MADDDPQKDWSPIVNGTTRLLSSLESVQNGLAGLAEQYDEMITAVNGLYRGMKDVGSPPSGVLVSCQYFMDVSQITKQFSNKWQEYLLSPLSAQVITCQHTLEIVERKEEGYQTEVQQMLSRLTELLTNSFATVAREHRRMAEDTAHLTRISALLPPSSLAVLKEPAKKSGSHLPLPPKIPAPTALPLQQQHQQQQPQQPQHHHQHSLSLSSPNAQPPESFPLSKDSSAKGVIGMRTSPRRGISPRSKRTKRTRSPSNPNRNQLLHHPTSPSLIPLDRPKETTSTSTSPDTTEKKGSPTERMKSPRKFISPDLLQQHSPYATLRRVRAPNAISEERERSLSPLLQQRRPITPTRPPRRPPIGDRNLISSPLLSSPLPSSPLPSPLPSSVAANLSPPLLSATPPPPPPEVEQRKIGSPLSLTEEKTETNEDPVSEMDQLCVAIANFSGTGPSELTFEKGDILHILDDKSEDWWIGAHLNKVAFFPRSYVTLIPQNHSTEEKPPPIPPRGHKPLSPSPSPSSSTYSPLSPTSPPSSFEDSLSLLTNRPVVTSSSSCSNFQSTSRPVTPPSPPVSSSLTSIFTAGTSQSTSSLLTRDKDEGEINFSMETETPRTKNIRSRMKRSHSSVKKMKHKVEKKDET